MARHARQNPRAAAQKTTRTTAFHKPRSVHTERTFQFRFQTMEKRAQAKHCSRLEKAADVRHLGQRNDRTRSRGAGAIHSRPRENSEPTREVPGRALGVEASTKAAREELDVEEEPKMLASTETQRTAHPSGTQAHENHPQPPRDRQTQTHHRRRRARHPKPTPGTRDETASTQHRKDPQR